MLCVGIDIGSLSTDAVLMNDKKEVIASEVIATGASSKKAADKIWASMLATTGVLEKDIRYVVATGYGRIRVPFANEVVTEITCHGKGAHFFFPRARTVIDIGGQDSKVIKVDPNGSVLDFVMNDKCAAGTGRFLEVMARTLEIDLDEMGPLSLEGSGKLSISSLCTVFAESEVVSLIGADHKVPDICRALHMAISKRIAAQVRRVGVEGQVVMSGGVAKNVGMVKELEKLLGVKFRIAEEPQITGAVGAALIGLEAVERTEKKKVTAGAAAEPRTVSSGLKAEKGSNAQSILKAGASLEDDTLPRIGYLCTYTPVEIIRAAGFHPVRIKGAENCDGAAEEHLCANLCSYIKSVMEEKLSGALDDLEGMVFVNSCDGMRRLYDAWRAIDGDKKFNYIIDMPKTNDDAAVEYFAKLIVNFKEKLEVHSKRRITNEEIKDSINRYNRMRKRVKLFLHRCWSGYLSHSGYEVFSLLKQGINAVPEKFTDYLKLLMKDKRRVKDTNNAPRLLIWGGILEDEAIVKIIEDAGARVVADDLCSGTRFYDVLVEVNGDPFMSLANRYLKRSPCSRMVNASERISNVLTKIQEMSIHGAIYHSLKFCDHSLYDYPLIKKEFDKHNVPVLHLTCDYGRQNEGQLKTRIEAFLEQLQTAKN
ncbi:MAG: acyl-CoA dehydratase activase [Candidatus Brocadiales bacterium]|nr:2-hydroxyacyl-CoA dehydratase [Candidatus Bathyanammoxibius sp.]MCQ4574372.1 acyl-CoA dehydratase activase [Candidatus Bathyanammoxibius amoris]